MTSTALQRGSMMRKASRRGPVTLVLLCGVPLFLWLAAAPIAPRFSGTYASLTSLAVVLALAGTAAFALNLVLGARIRAVEALFGGLDRMYAAHRRTGQLAFALLLGHVVLILASRATVSAESALGLLGPGAGLTVFSGVVAFSALTVGIVLTLFVRLGHEVFVYVQRSFGIVFLLATFHVFTTPGAKQGSTALTVYLAALSTLGVVAFVYRSALGNVLVRRRRYRVVDVNRLDDSVTEIVMEPLARPLAYLPGQFVFVSFRSLALGEQLHPFELSLSRQVLSIRAGEIGNQFHPFSITSAPDESTLRITVKAVGDYTGALRRLDAGAEAIVEGPYGSFTPARVTGGRQVWAAGGIGVTPFLSMARSLGPTNDVSIDFYYCVEHEGEAHFLDELREIARDRDGFRVVLVSRNRDGFLTGRRLAEEHGDLHAADLLVCGPPAMIESLRAQLMAEGVPAERFHAEEFTFARHGGAAASPPDSTSLSVFASGEARRRRPPLTDGQIVALLGAFALAAIMFAFGIAVGMSMAPRGNADPGASGPPTADSVAAGRIAFETAGCGTCHALDAAGSSGSAGPDLDDARPDAARVRDIVSNGSGVMPSFAGELTQREIGDLAVFVGEAAGR